MRYWAFSILFSLLSQGMGDVLIPLNSEWKYVKGTAEASNPSAAWRNPAFADSGWTSGNAPFYYGENLGAGTVLGDMRNAYTTFYLRKTFSISNPADYDRLVLRAFVDDGYIVWINGREVARFNMEDGDHVYNSTARATIEPTWVTNSLANPSAFLVTGPNTIAVHVFNRPITSSDIVFDLQLDSDSDRNPPVISQVTPQPGQVSELSSVTITFSEAVQGVTAEDFLLNNQPAESVAGSGTTYTFSFPQPEFGPVDITWDAGHQITDFADPPHRFAEVTLQYVLRDSTAPFVLSTVPPPGGAVRTLSQIEIRFSEAVTNVTADDLLLNGNPAASLQARSDNTYVFEFPPQAAGSVNVTWTGAHAISDLALPANAFVPQPWSYTVNPNLTPAQVVISEFLASAENAAGLKDEDGELQDWIELYNSGSTTVNLAGWSLTDDPEETGLWTFPNVSIPAGGRIVVFASAKDRKPIAAGSRLHTNFKLSAGGEYVALFNADSPRAPMTTFPDDYPDQRNDYSYGIDASGAWRYYQTPTPGQPNGSSSILGVVPKPDASHKRGWYEAPFALSLTNGLPGVTIRYTTDGSVPTETVGRLYTSPISVSSNLVFRAAAFRATYLPSEIITHTYLFPDQILRQPNNPAGFPTGPTVMAGYPSDYEMDPEIVNDPAYSGQMRDALKALPVMSIVIKMDDMFGAANGIYTHPLSRGPQWERPCSLEFIPLDGEDFQVDAGLQVQGNAAREPIKQPKHPLRVTFKGDYGPKKLDYHLFPDSPVRSFDTLVLRADFNYSWLHWNPSQRIRAQRTRDSWMKDTMRSMGGLASHNRYVHMFINGLYWGIYDPSERPDGSFGEAYMGGEKEDYDVINEGAVVDGTGTVYNSLLAAGDVSTLPEYEAIKHSLDIPQFIDYMLLHFFVGHEDWGNNKNWYTIRPRNGSRGFLYVPWDGEMILGDQGMNRVNNPDVPSGLHTKLLSSEQYRLDFADHAHRHLFNDGALTPARNISRWRKRATEIELPIIAESARWGDYRRDVHQYQSPPYELYTREDQWRAEQNRLINSYFPARTGTILNQLRNAGLYPTVVAPSFSQHGGKIDPGFSLRITAPAGTIYYAANGNDPRVYGTGNVSPLALAYSAPIPLSASAVIKTRVLSGGTWSALTEATFSAGSPRIPLRITEIMYNSEPPGDAFEFIELTHFGEIPLDISGYYLEGIDYVFPPQTVVTHGQILLLASAENPSGFAQRYPGAPVFGRFNGQLLNRGERLALVAPNGRTIQSVDYDDDSGWPEGADGGGYSLEIKDAFGDPDDPANWQQSVGLNGSPARTNSMAVVKLVIINEVFAASQTSPDWVELADMSGSGRDLSGWRLEEAGNTNHFIFPPGATLAAGGYLIVHCNRGTNLPGLHAPFALDADGETLILRDNNGALVDVFTFGPQANELSVGKIFLPFTLTSPTPGNANTRADVGSPASLVINEWLANPAPGDADWLEIHNTDPSRPVSLQGLFLSVSNQLFEITSVGFVSPRGHARLIADELPGPDHVDFKLPSAGGTISLLDNAGKTLNAVTYGAQTESVSQGRYPDAADTIVSFPNTPTPGSANSLTLAFPVAFAAVGAEIELQWPSVATKRYRVEWSDNLSTWTALTEVTASGASASAKDSLQFSRRYYRVSALP